MSQSDLLVSRPGAIGRLSLNRPQALGALTTGMCQTMIEALVRWREDDEVRAVLIDHVGDRGFCAGGDVRILAAGGEQAQQFFFIEYRLDHLIFGYPKPVVTVMDGLTMGGGVGISWGAQYRIATGRTAFAMPETGIGLFPDVGGGWFLPRLHGKAGLWLALTGARLKAAGCELLGIVTDVIPTARVEEFKTRLAAEPEAVETILAEMETDPGGSTMIAHHDEIDRLFAGHSVEAIIADLQAEASPWALEQLEILAAKSPLSLKVAFRQLREGAAMRDFAEVMQMEMRLAARLVAGHDFREGVRAAIIDKDNRPRWAPERLEEVTPAMLDGIFAPLPEDEEWTPQPVARARADPARRTSHEL